MMQAVKEIPAARPREQLEEMFRRLTVDEQIRLLALISIRRGTYHARQWRKAIKGASAAHRERTAAGLNPWLE